MKKIPFTVPTIVGSEIEELSRVITSNNYSDPINYVNSYLMSVSKAVSVYFCSSCSHALEMSGLILKINPGDQVIVPDFTFVTSASAFALRGAQIIFADINLEDMCLDSRSLENSINENTKAVVWVDYAGNSMRAKEIKAICKKYNLPLIQDAAQSIGNWLNTSENNPFVGDFISYSFHSTKNITSGGEGGALMVMNKSYQEQSSIVFEKGTNRTAFLRGEVDKYTWRELGASFTGSWSQAAFLKGQFVQLEKVSEERRKIWMSYHSFLKDNRSYRTKGWQYPTIENCSNAHIFWMLGPNADETNRFRKHMRGHGIEAPQHYQSLSNSPAGSKFGKVLDNVNNSRFASENLIRLPLWFGLDSEDIKRIKIALNNFYI